MNEHLAILSDAQMTCSLSTSAEACVCSTAAVPPICHSLACSTGNEAVGLHTVGIVYDAVMELHLREGHPEHPNRVKELNHQLHAARLLERCHRLTPKLATNDELLTCHSSEHIARVDNLYLNPVKDGGEPAECEGDTYIISGDIYCNAHTSTAARSAAGCAVQAVRAVLSGGVPSAFAVVRPPGHHAESNELMGFCFFNNVAVAAHAALQQPGIERVLILDWDVHHGNGTQQIFEQDKRVLFVSLHRRDGDFYPQGCGFASEVGVERGTGYTVNVPWVSKGMADADYLAAYDLILDPIIAQFDPQLVLVSAGFDAADGDFLGKCHVTPAGFAALTQRLMRHAGGKLVAVLEGGYVPWLVGNCASAVVQVLLGDSPPALCTQKSFKLHKTTQQVLATVDAIQRQHWSQLAALPAIAARYAEYSISLKMQWLSLNRTPSPPPSSLSAAAAARVTRSVTRAAAAAGGVRIKTARLPAAVVAAAAAAAETLDLVELLGGLSIQEGQAAGGAAAAAAAATIADSMPSPAVDAPAACQLGANREVTALGAMHSQQTAQPAAAQGAGYTADECLDALQGPLSILQQPVIGHLSAPEPAAVAGTAGMAGIVPEAAGIPSKPEAAVVAGLSAAPVPLPVAAAAAATKRINIKKTGARLAQTVAAPAEATVAGTCPVVPLEAQVNQVAVTQQSPDAATQGLQGSLVTAAHPASIVVVSEACSPAEHLVPTDAARQVVSEQLTKQRGAADEAAAVAAVTRKISIKKTGGRVAADVPTVVQAAAEERDVPAAAADVPAVVAAVAAAAVEQGVPAAAADVIPVVADVTAAAVAVSAAAVEQDAPAAAVAVSAAAVAVSAAAVDVSSAAAEASAAGKEVTWALQVPLLPATPTASAQHNAATPQSHHQLNCGATVSEQQYSSAFHTCSKTPANPAHPRSEPPATPGVAASVPDVCGSSTGSPVSLPVLDPSSSGAADASPSVGAETAAAAKSLQMAEAGPGFGQWILRLVRGADDSGPQEQQQQQQLVDAAAMALPDDDE